MESQKIRKSERGCHYLTMWAEADILLWHLLNHIFLLTPNKGSNKLIDQKINFVFLFFCLLQSQRNGFFLICLLPAALKQKNFNDKLRRTIPGKSVGLDFFSALCGITTRLEEEYISALLVVEHQNIGLFSPSSWEEQKVSPFFYMGINLVLHVPILWAWRCSQTGIFQLCLRWLGEKLKMFWRDLQRWWSSGETRSTESLTPSLKLCLLTGALNTPFLGI